MTFYIGNSYEDTTGEKWLVCDKTTPFRGPLEGAVYLHVKRYAERDKDSYYIAETDVAEKVARIRVLGRDIFLYSDPTYQHAEGINFCPWCGASLYKADEREGKKVVWCSECERVSVIRSKSDPLMLKYYEYINGECDING